VNSDRSLGRVILTVAIWVVIVVGLGWLIAGNLGTQSAAIPNSATAAQAPSILPASPILGNDVTTAVRKVAERVRPAVVQISNTKQVRLEDFNQPFTVPVGVGSGVIYDNQGHILTNNHVVEGAQDLLVSLPDGRSFKGRLIGADPQTDLAVVQIAGDNLPVAQLGDSNQLAVGDWVVAIGNALALPGGPTVTKGVVSALRRTVQEPPSSGSNAAGPFIFDAIQTDAPINPGNSGGPLLNLDGQVVGINTLVAGEVEAGVQAQGVGFAISTATAKPIADQLVAAGRVTHPYLGIAYVPLSPLLAAQLGVDTTDGVVVQTVVPGSPADKAGLERADVITAVDNVPLKTDSAFAEIVSKHQPGDTVTLTVERGNRTLQMKVTLGVMPAP